MYIYVPIKTFNPEKHFKDIPLHQGDLFRRWQLSAGRNVVSLAVDGPDTAVHAYIQCVEHRIPFLGSVWTARHGPVGSFASASIEEAFYHDLRRYCTDIAPGTIHIRIQQTPMNKRIRIQAVPEEEERDQVVTLNQTTDSAVKDCLENTESLKHSDLRIHLETVDFKVHLSDVYALIGQSISDPQPFSYYETLFSQLHENPEYAALTLGYTDGHRTPTAAVLAVYTGNEARLILAVSRADIDVLAQVICTAIKEAKHQDLQRCVLDVESSGISTDAKWIFYERLHADIAQVNDQWDIVVSSWRYRIFRSIDWYPIKTAYRFLRKWFTIALIELRNEYQR